MEPRLSVPPAGKPFSRLLAIEGIFAFKEVGQPDGILRVSQSLILSETLRTLGRCCSWFQDPVLRDLDGSSPDLLRSRCSPLPLEDLSQRLSQRLLLDEQNFEPTSCCGGSDPRKETSRLDVGSVDLGTVWLGPVCFSGQIIRSTRMSPSNHVASKAKFAV